jgi:phage baseplate assembly protein W
MSVPDRAENPHFAFPFQRGSVLEQDTPEHVLSCLLVIAHCPIGFRLERPDFGIPWMEYRTQIDPSSSVEDALLELEPRAEMREIGVVRELLDPGGTSGAVARLTYEVEVDGG